MNKFAILTLGFVLALSGGLVVANLLESKAAAVLIGLVYGSVIASIAFVIIEYGTGVFKSDK